MLRYGVLGLLIERRGYGYELVQRLAARLGAAWQLNPSAVYTALDQLEAAGLIEASAAGGPEAATGSADGSSRAGGSGAAESAAGGADGTGADGSTASAGPRRSVRRSGRVFYRPTECGVAAFQAWLARPAERVEPIRSELQLKVALVSPDSVPSLLASISHEERLIMHSLQQECSIAGEARQAGAAGGPLALSRAGAGGKCGGGPAPGSAASSWSAAASALVSAAAAARLQGELLWLQTVRETLQRMLGENVAASAAPVLVDAASLG